MKSQLIVSFLVFGALVSPAESRCHSQYYSLDGVTTLEQYRSYYYLGTANHPKSLKFLMDFGQRVETAKIGSFNCISLGVFAFAKPNSRGLTCRNVLIKRSHLFPGKTIFEATCGRLMGPRCSLSNPVDRSDLKYAYQVRDGSGVTEIYLAGLKQRTPSNTLVLRSSCGLLVATP